MKGVGQVFAVVKYERRNNVRGRQTLFEEFEILIRLGLESDHRPSTWDFEIRHAILFFFGKSVSAIGKSSSRGSQSDSELSKVNLLNIKIDKADKMRMRFF